MAEQRGVGLSLRDVRKEFDGAVLAVDGVTLDISPGEFVAILGPSGCGKSTLLRMIAGLDQPTSGSIRQMDPTESCTNISTGVTDGGSRTRSDAAMGRIAYVFQDAHLLPWRSVLRNVSLPLELRGIPKEDRLDAARRAIESVGLSDFAHRYPAQLSGGMRMRVSLARALVNHPSLLLLDEPFAALDEITRAQLDEQLREVWLDSGMTILFVTHSITEAAFLADRAIVLTRRPAKIVMDTPVDLPRQRRNVLRGEAEFARHTRILLDALLQGGA